MAIVALGALILAGSAADAPAAADSHEETAFVEAINEIRADLGLVELQVHAELADLAREHTIAMADAGEIFHADPISAGLTAEWLKLGENVGVGAGVDVLIDAFLASPGHYANIIDPSFTHIGIGVVWTDALYTTHRFLQPARSEDDPGQPPPPTTSDAIHPVDEPAASPSDAVVSRERVVALLALLEDVG